MSWTCPMCGDARWSTASDGLGNVAAVSACCIGCGYITSRWVDLTDTQGDRP